MSPRLLMLSGVGPFHRHDEIFADGFSVPFHIDNPDIGTSLFDHVATSVTFEYSGAAPQFSAHHYGDYAANTADLSQYAGARSGPYAQYGPVSVMQEYVDSRFDLGCARRGNRRQPNVEVFVNPFGVGAAEGPYNGPKNLTALAMLLRPRASGLMQIDKDGFVKYPPIYLTDAQDLELMTESIFQLLAMFRDNRDLQLVFGPGRPLTPEPAP